MARSILENKHFTLRVLTRDVTRKNALEFRDLGAEVVRCDLDDAASVDEALKGAHGAFVVTNFWDHLSKEKEVCQVGAEAFLLYPLTSLPLPLPTSVGSSLSLGPTVSLALQHSLGT